MPRPQRELGTGPNTERSDPHDARERQLWADLGEKVKTQFMNILPLEKQVRAISALTEGCSIRSAARLVDADRETVMNLGVRVGEGCRRFTMP